MSSYYTPEQLRTQLEIAKRQISIEENRIAEVQDPSWQLAKDYGDGIRENHLDTISRRIDHLRRRVAAITLALPKGESA